MVRLTGSRSQSTKRRCYVGGFVGGCTLMAVAVVYALTASFNDADLAHAEKHWPEDSMHPSLHSQARFPDGARGFEIGEPIALQVAKPVIPAQFSTVSDFEAHIVQCNADGLILGKWIDSRPVLSSRKNDVYTRSRFVVLQVIKSDGSLRPQESIVTFRVGGEVTDEAEVLRVLNTNAPDYERGESYLLELKIDRGANRRQYFASDFGTISVRGQRIIPSAGTWAGFSPDTPYSSVVTKLKELAAIPCSVN